MASLWEQRAFGLLKAALARPWFLAFTHPEARSLIDYPIPAAVKFDAAPVLGHRDLIIICRPCDDWHPLILLDNEIGECASCGRRVQFRPHCPKGPKTCLFCAARLVEMEWRREEPDTVPPLDLGFPPGPAPFARASSDG